MSHHKLKEGLIVWVKDKAIAGTDFFTKGRILNVNGNKVTVETSNAVKTQELILPVAECHMMHPGDDVPDHCQLMYLSQPTLLENTRQRYMRDVIYTYVGDILVAVNPFKMIKGLYDTSVMAQCRGKRLHNASCGPHVFMISEKAYVTMKKKKHNQCIVVSGESGAGKTETNRQLLNYLVWRGSDSSSDNSLTQKIMDANPILEAFGNAKTTRNNNSSRFGRYALVQFNGINEVVGAQVRTFLLERSRVTSTLNANERSYHVLYQLVRGGTAYTQGKAESFYYLNLSGCTEVVGMDDAADFVEVHKSLVSVGYLEAEVQDMWSFIAAMLYLGNITFGDGDKAVVQDQAPMLRSSSLLGCGDFSELLVTRVIQVRGDVTKADQSPKQAALARDSLVKIMYARLFTFLVSRINQTVDKTSQTRNYIGLLDVYGFEFFQVNSFEQLCINFANEKLQGFFLETVFAGEEAVYKEEGIPWTPIKYEDNKEIIDLLEAPNVGVYATLDSACKTPNASGKTFCAQLHDTHAKSKVFAAPKLSSKKGAEETRSKEDHFVVKHFAGDVVYNCNEFLEKNNDTLTKEFEEELLRSSKPLTVAICTPEEEKSGAPGSFKGKKGGGFTSVGLKFIASLKSLMLELRSSEAHFVRCIKSNPELKPHLLHGESVINQLRMSGTLDAVRLIQGGFPTRIPYEAIHGRYRDIMPSSVGSLPPPEFCEVIAEVVGIGRSDYSLGLERMFFKMGAAAFLEELQDADPEEMKPILLEKLRIFELKRKSKPIIEKDLVMWLHKRKYATLVAEKRKKEAVELAKEEERMRKEEEKRKREEEQRRRRDEEEKKLKEQEQLAKAKEEERLLHEVRASTRTTAASGDFDTGKLLEEAKAKKAAEAEQAARTLGDVEAMINALEQDADLEQAVAAAGGVGTLIAMAAKHDDSALVQAQFAGVLRDLCISDEIAIEIDEAGGVDAIIAAARRHYDSVDVQAAVAGALRNLSELDQIAEKICRKGGIEVLVDASARHPNDATVAARVAGALWGLSVHDDIAEVIGSSGGTDALITSAKAHPMDAEVQASTAGAMRNLSVSDENKHSIADIEGLEVLIAASENHLESALVQAQVAGALRNLSLNDEVAEQIAVSGGIEVLVNASAEHRSNSKVQAGVAGALRNLSVNDEIAEEIASAGGIDALVTASQEHPNNSDVQAEVAGALWGLSVNDEIEEAIAQADGIRVLVDAARNHFSNAKVQARVAGALRKLSANDENKHEIAATGGIEMLIQSSQIHLSNAVVQAGVAGALANLSVDDEIEQKIASTGGIEVLINAATAHLDNVKVQARVVRALTNLSVHDANKAKIASTKGITTLIKSSFEHQDSAEVQAGVAGALRNLSVSPDIAQLIVQNDAIKSLVQAAQIHTHNAIVQAGVAGALRNLSVNEQNRKIIIDHGGLRALKDAAQRHAENEKLQIEVSGALRNLMGEPKRAEPPGERSPATPSAPSAPSKPVALPLVPTETAPPADAANAKRKQPAQRKPSFGRRTGSFTRSISPSALFGGLSRCTPPFAPHAICPS
ncbi:hypothetical protein AB1Y20_005884 [Prymnesium parvum]|uniref:Myosin motor domain-containing protein n=1 Tax=Prymnesium parvum TaxID=97485 RepID=A0AB34J321_PRYPA